MINFLKRVFFSKDQSFKITNEEEKPVPFSKSDTFVDLVVSLNKSYEIDIQLFMDDNTKNKNLTEVEYALALSEFLHIIMYGKLKAQLLELIIKQIQNKNNKNFIDKILGFLILMDKNQTENSKQQFNYGPMIKPSQVFSRYKNESI
jgi:hypothetical protein